MEQFRQIGEAIGSLNSLMVFRDNIEINHRQCCLLYDMLNMAYELVAEEMKQNLIFEEKQTKWRVLEQPLRELHQMFKEGELYIRQCLDTRNWWAKAITLYQNKDCVDFHLHNLLCCIPIVIEAIEMAGEISGQDQNETQKRRSVYSMKYQRECKDPKVFEWKFGKQYLVSPDICSRMDHIWEEDRWILSKSIQEKKVSGSGSKQDIRLADLLFRNINESEPFDRKLLPCSILANSKDYQMRRRLGNGRQYKEIQWLGESLAVRHFYGDIEPVIPEICQGLSLSHPNVMQFFCAFTDDKKKECFLVMELMNRDLSTHIKEQCGPKKRVPFSLPVAVDLMLQISRGMEYLHSKKIYHGDLNPKNILIKARHSSLEGYLHAKISGFRLAPSTNDTGGEVPFIWYAPEILAFEDSHLQGDKMSRNIRAGERPLFPCYSPKYLTNLTKRCWHAEPSQRPTFSSVGRILRYIKRFLLLHPNHSDPDPPMPSVDYFETETTLLKSFPYWGNLSIFSVSQVPFQMFAYRVVEKERTNSYHANQRENSESESDGASALGDDHVNLDEPVSARKYCSSPETTNSCPSPESVKYFASPENVNKKNQLRRLSLNRLPLFVIFDCNSVGPEADFISSSDGTSLQHLSKAT